MDGCRDCQAGGAGADCHNEVGIARPPRECPRLQDGQLVTFSSIGDGSTSQKLRVLVPESGQGRAIHSPDGLAQRLPAQLHSRSGAA
jgi:hypothetical protein